MELFIFIIRETEKEYIEKISYKKKGLPPHFAVNKRQEDEEALKNALRPVEFENQTDQSPQVDKELRDILEKVDNRVFVGTKKQFDVYNTFDTDKDGIEETLWLIFTINLRVCISSRFYEKT